MVFHPLAPTQNYVQIALRKFLLSILPEMEVIEGYDNKVPEPDGDNYVVMTTLRRTRLATNRNQLDPVGNVAAIEQPVMVVIQINVHGVDVSMASDMAQTISTLFRDDVAVEFFKAFPGIAPLHADDPKLIPFNNAEQQYEPRYVIEAALQANQAVTVEQQSATVLDITLVNVDARIPEPPSG
jgi:hypothetical protein